MGNRFLVGVAVTLALSVTMARATTAPKQQSTSAIDYEKFTVLSLGGTDCGAITEELRTNRKMTFGALQAYAGGFITGANFQSSSLRLGNPNVSLNTSMAAVAQPLSSIASSIHWRSL